MHQGNQFIYRLMLVHFICCYLFPHIEFIQVSGEVCRTQCPVCFHASQNIEEQVQQSKNVMSLS